MNRREFCAGVASAITLPAAALRGQTVGAIGPSEASLRDPNPAGGYTPEPPREFLFTDFRHISPGDLGWRAPDGKALPVAGPPAPPVDAHADADNVAQGIRLVAQKATKQGPIEGLPSRVIFDQGTYRSWGLHADYGQAQNLGSYTMGPAQKIAISYAESKDGFSWQRRECGSVRPPPVTGIDGDYFFIDPHGPAEERYKCIYNARVLSGLPELWKQYEKIHPRHRDVRIRPDMVYCLFGMVSADGFNWRTLPDPLLIHMGDTDNTVYYDAWQGKYVLYTRLYWTDRRMVARAESDDFKNWSPVTPVLWPRLEDPPSWDIYTNGASLYPGLPEHHLMFPVFYRRLTQTSEVHLHSSLDGARWDRVPGGPVLVSGEPGTWDGGWLVAGRDLVPLGADKVAIPYSATDYPHKYPRWPGVISGNAGYAVWPRGRLAALVTEDRGSFRTFPVQVTGEKLVVNARVARGGEIRVELSGVRDRSSADCDPIFGDHQKKTVSWKGDSRLGIEKGKSVTLSFRMRSAELFGFEWV